MQIQCECGKFRAEIKNFPQNTPGRLACYCDDCQTYLHYIKRTDLLDEAGGTEIIPVYPADLKIHQGHDALKCARLSPKGLDRWSASCCKTPLFNARPGLPWLGMHRAPFSNKTPAELATLLGPVRSRVMGNFARGNPPAGTSNKMSLKDAAVVAPFLLKGLLLRKAKNSPVYENDGKTPVVKPEVISLEERSTIRQMLGF